MLRVQMVAQKSEKDAFSILSPVKRYMAAKPVVKIDVENELYSEGEG